MAAGSAIGREHRRLGRNNQDAWACAVGPGLLVAAVADGCSSGAHTEVGARLAVHWMAAALPALWRQADGRLSADLASQAAERLVDYFRAVAAPLVGEAWGWPRCVGELLKDADVEIRRAAVEALENIDDPAVTRALREALKDADPEVRRIAAKALGNRSH